jgi:3'5'-cyclic nucleotide phosphodiesterase
MQEFLNQGVLEKQLNLPLSPNMDPDLFDQAATQLSFVEFIVEPLFECFAELFPRCLSLMDLIEDNTRQWSSVFEASKSKKPQNRKVTVGSSSSRGSSAVVANGVINRKLSSAAGTIEIPESVQKYYQSKSSKKASIRSMGSFSGNESSLSPDIQMVLKEVDGL